MKINQIQSQLTINRRCLAVAHEVKQAYKSGRSDPDAPEEFKLECHKAVVKMTAKIAKLEALQKALKSDLSHAIDFQRTMRMVERLHASAMNNVGECYE